MKSISVERKKMPLCGKRMIKRYENRVKEAKCFGEMFWFVI